MSTEATKTTPEVELVVPVHDEERVLARSIYRLHRFLERELRFSWRIVIADNASTDLTPDLALQLSRELPHVSVLRLDEKGRGRALRAAWSQSRARVVCYMDVDLSTDLRALPTLLAPLLSGHSELAIGSRLAAGARVRRGAKREIISRGYNYLLRLVLGARFSDAQCGFKAVRADVLPELLADIRDQQWFFDTELLVLAARRGMRIHEVPVDWIEDTDSRVDIPRTALRDLQGVARLRLATPGARLVLIGALSALVYLSLSLVLPGALGLVSLLGLAAALATISRYLALGSWVVGPRRHRLP